MINFIYNHILNINTNIKRRLPYELHFRKNKLIMTSGYNFENHVITDYLGFCTGECVLGTGFLSSFDASISDLLGSSSSLYEEKLGNAKQLAFDELCNNARRLGANAIIGLDIDYTTFSSDIIGVIANGTAVKITPSNMQISSPVQVEVTNYNPDLSFRTSTLWISSSAGEQALSAVLSGDSDESVAAINADIHLITIFEEEFTFQNVGFANFQKMSGSADRLSTATPCRIPAEIIPLVKSAQVLIKKYITDGKILTIADNNLPWAKKREHDISEAVSQGLNVQKYIAHISSLSSAADILKYTQDINEEHNCITFLLKMNKFIALYNLSHRLIFFHSPVRQTFSPLHFSLN